MRNNLKTLPILSGLFLALTISAVAQSTVPQSPNRRDTGSQTVTSPSSPSTTGNGQTAPGSEAPAAPGSAAPSAQPSTPSNGNQGTAQQSENKGADIDRELQLTDDQKQKIAAVVDDENRQIAAVRDDNSMSLEQKQQKVLQIRQTGSPKIKAILTPEQLQKLAALQQRMRDQQNGTQTSSPSGTQSAPPANPQNAPQSATPQH